MALRLHVDDRVRAFALRPDVATLYRGSLAFEAPMLYALAFIGLSSAST